METVNISGNKISFKSITKVKKEKSPFNETMKNIGVGASLLGFLGVFTSFTNTFNIFGFISSIVFIVIGFSLILYFESIRPKYLLTVFTFDGEIKEYKGVYTYEEAEKIHDLINNHINV